MRGQAAPLEPLLPLEEEARSMERSVVQRHSSFEASKVWALRLQWSSLLQPERKPVTPPPQAQGSPMVEERPRQAWTPQARLPQALLVTGSACADDRMISAGLEALDWLSATQRGDADHHFVPIGSQGFYHQGGEKARFDQQPIEAAGAVSACLEAWRITGDTRWHDEAWSAFNWFLGDNDLQLPLYDFTTGGCRDGLHPDRANENQGAESTLSFLMALLEMRSQIKPKGNTHSPEEMS